MTRHGDFQTQIEYKGWPIDVTVDYFYNDGTDPIEDPRDVELLLVTDGTESNIMEKLDEKTIMKLRSLAFEREL